MTTHELLRLWLARSEADSALAPNTLASYRASTRTLSRYLPDVDAVGLRPLELQRVISQIAEERGPGSALACYHLFRMAWTYATNCEEMPARRCPAVLVKPPRTRRRSQDWVGIETVQAIYAEATALGDAGNVAGRAIQLALLTGLRLRSDILPLRVGSVDSKSSLLRFRVAKSGRAEALPVSGDALEVLRDLEARAVGGWLFPGKSKHQHLANVYRPWARVLDAVAELGLCVEDSDGKRLVPHHCRHARVAHCLAAGESPMLVGLGVGQTDPLSVRHYAAARIGALRGPAETFARLVRDPKHTPPADVAATFARRLTEAAARASRSPADLAESLAVSPAAVRHWLAGRALPGLATAGLLADALGCSVDWLLGR